MRVSFQCRLVIIDNYIYIYLSSICRWVTQSVILFSSIIRHCSSFLSAAFTPKCNAQCNVTMISVSHFEWDSLLKMVWNNLKQVKYIKNFVKTYIAKNRIPIEKNRKCYFVNCSSGIKSGSSPSTMYTWTDNSPKVRRSKSWCWRYQ